METSNRVFDGLLRELDLPHIEERVPRSAFYELGLKFPQQYAVAARDVAACVKRAESVGAGPFLHATIPAPNWVERGERRKGCKLEIALGYAGDRQVEFLGPGEGTQLYAGELGDADYVFHHVGIYQNGMAELAANIQQAGYPEVVRGGVQLGRALSFDFRYFDSRDALGIYLEVQDYGCFGRELQLEPFIRGLAKFEAFAGRR